MTKPALDLLLDELTRPEPPPVAPWTDLTRGRRARRRRRGGATVGTMLVAASIGTVVAFGGLPTLPHSNVPQPADVSSDGPAQPLPLSYAAPVTPPAPDAVEYVPEVVPDEDVLARCRAMPGGKDQGDHLVPSRRPIYPGDWVMIPALPGGDADVGCMARGAWLPSPEHPVDDVFMDPGDTAAILYACSAEMGVDLQSWTVTAAMADGLGGVSAAIVSPGQGFFEACDLGASGSDDSRFDSRSSPAARHAAGPSFTGLSADAGFSCSNCNGGDVYSWAGVLPRGMESAVIVLGDGTQVPVPVGVDGTYAVRIAVPRADPTIIRTFDGDGAVVGDYFLNPSPPAP